MSICTDRDEKLEKQSAAGEEHGVILARLDEILQQSSDLSVQFNRRSAYFELQQEMHDMRDRLG